MFRIITIVLKNELKSIWIVGWVGQVKIIGLILPAPPLLLHAPP